MWYSAVLELWLYLEAEATGSVLPEGCASATGGRLFESASGKAVREVRGSAYVTVTSR